MQPVLVIGLGNPLMGDDGIGCLAAERLSRDPRLPQSIEVLCGGSDLLRLAPAMKGRSRVFLIDALLDDASAPGNVTVVEDPSVTLNRSCEQVHHLSVGAAMALLQMTMPVRFVLLGISIMSAACGPLSPALAARLPAILERLRAELIESVRPQPDAGAACASPSVSSPPV